jgi:hypothetical protein
MMVTEIGPSDLKDLHPYEQRDLMRWFLANYEGPTERAPYDSAGGIHLDLGWPVRYPGGNRRVLSRICPRIGYLRVRIHRTCGRG